MTTHPNHVPISEVTPDQLDALLQRSIDRDAAEREARQRAAAWPTEVEQLLATLARRSRTQADALGAIHDRLAKLEGSMGIAPA